MKDTKESVIKEVHELVQRLQEAGVIDSIFISYTTEDSFHANYDGNLAFLLEVTKAANELATEYLQEIMDEEE